MVAECFTRPQYVLRSYCETGRSRVPGSEDVILYGEKAVKQQQLLRAHKSSWTLVGARVGKYNVEFDVGSTNGKRERARAESPNCTIQSDKRWTLQCIDNALILYKPRHMYISSSSKIRLCNYLTWLNSICCQHASVDLSKIPLVQYAQVNQLSNSAFQMRYSSHIQYRHIVYHLFLLLLVFRWWC